MMQPTIIRAMRQTSFAHMHCSLAQALDLIGDWWTPLILRDLFLGLDRFDDLATDLGISRNLLTTRLAELVEHGIVERRRYSERPPRDRYVLTQAGRELAPIFAALTAWGDRWAQPEGGPPVRFEHTLCNHTFKPVVTCSNCGKPVAPDDLRVLPGPGGRSAPGTLLYGRSSRRSAQDSARGGRRT
jgi:DNA-binding HxlR family transcriptional regulator